MTFQNIMRTFITFCLLILCASVHAATRPFGYPISVTSASTNLVSFKVTANTNQMRTASNLVEIILGTDILLRVPATNVSSGFRSSVGIQSGSFTNQNISQFTNTFAVAYSNAPIVTFTSSSTGAVAAVYSITKSNFVGGISITNLTTNYWTAIGQALGTP